MCPCVAVVARNQHELFPWYVGSSQSHGFKADDWVYLGVEAEDRTRVDRDVFASAASSAQSVAADSRRDCRTIVAA